MDFLRLKRFPKCLVWLRSRLGWIRLRDQVSWDNRFSQTCSYFFFLLWLRWVLPILLNQVSYDPRSYESNLCNCVYRSLKNSGLQRGLNPWSRDTGATLHCWNRNKLLLRAVWFFPNILDWKSNQPVFITDSNRNPVHLPSPASFFMPCNRQNSCYLLLLSFHYRSLRKRCSYKIEMRAGHVSGRMYIFGDLCNQASVQ